MKARKFKLTGFFTIFSCFLFTTMSHNLLFSTDPNHRWSPRHLQAMSYLYGLHTTDSDHATVLELGCGMGANLLPFAVAYPNANATGIDIDGEKIAAGQLHLAQHGIKNITLYTADIASLLESELEQYDYILIRGLFAQTDLETRTALLSWCQKHLSPDGIICIGYQTYPGSKVTDSLYEAFAFHAAQSEQPEEQVAGIKAMLSFMSDGISYSNPLYQQIKPALHILEEKNDEQLYIETFAGLHNPCYFIEFANSLANTGLCYVGDADAHTEIPAHWGNDTEHLYQVINPQKNKVFGQQYLDLLCGRATRMSILTHAAHAEKIEFEPNTDKLIDLRWAGYFKRKEIDENSITDAFTLANDETIQTKNPTSQEVFDTLGWAWPFSVDSHSLLKNTAQEEEIIALTDKSIKNLKHSLESIFIQLGHKIHYSLTPTPYDLSTDEAITWAYKNKLKINRKFINLWHNSVNFKDYDDTKDLSALINQLSIDNNKHIKNTIKYGLAIGNNESWLSYYMKSSNLNEKKDSIINNILPIFFHSFSEIIGRKQKNDKYYNHKRDKEDSKNIKKIFNLLKSNKKNNAKILCEKTLEKKPYLDEIWHELFAINLNESTLADINLITQSIKLNTYNIIYFQNLCSGLHKTKNHLNKIYPLAKRILLLTKNHPNTLDTLGLIFNDRNKKHIALSFHKKAVEISPESPSFSSNLASLYSDVGKLTDSLKIYEYIINKNKNLFHLYSNYLFLAIHSDIYNSEKLFEIHKEYGNRVTQWVKKQNWQPIYNINTSVNRPLRIGFVSGDLREHAVTKFLLPYWENLDKNKFTIYAYHNHPIEDHISTRLKTHTKNWLNVYAMSHLELAQQINSDQIDILIDLSGHTAYNRLPVFGLKPAPVQMTWIGYPATTGLEQMDYKIILAAYAKLDWMQEQFTEKLLYMDVVPAFDNTIKLPAITEQMPCEKNGYFTFASFNRPQKISDEVLKTWAEIMKLCPNDKLLIANMPDDETTASFKEKLIDFGVKEEQLLFKKRVGIDEYMEMHNEVDLLLDTFPYRGGTTTNHAIAMGAATISLAGNTMVSHPAIFYTYQLEDFLSFNLNDYVQKALLWRNSPDDLLDIKKTLRMKFNEIQSKNDYVKKISKLLETTWKKNA